ncbi:hypothetical protein BGZ65_007947, partial [Modicella reniformis]
KQPQGAVQVTPNSQQPHHEPTQPNPDQEERQPEQPGDNVDTSAALANSSPAATNNTTGTPPAAQQPTKAKRKRITPEQLEDL